jgi:hypothetical protein
MTGRWVPWNYIYSVEDGATEWTARSLIKQSIKQSQRIGCWHSRPIPSLRAATSIAYLRTNTTAVQATD